MVARIAVVGSLNMDLVVRSTRIPQPGETIIGRELHTVPGGKGANQAVAAARLGAQVTMIGRTGADSFAEPLLRNLAANGVDSRQVIQDPEVATGVALIVVDDHGQNSIVVASGANMRLSPDDVQAASEAISVADVLLLQLESPLETVQCAAELARQHDVLVVLNPAPARALPVSLLSLVNVLIPNESETALLTGLPTGTMAKDADAARALLDQDIDLVILTLGERGALLAQRDHVQTVDAFPVHPLDTTAAGDAFVGGFAVALAEGEGLSNSESLVEAVRWGNAAGALAATKLGAQTSLPFRHELLDLLGQTRSPTSLGKNLKH